MATTLTAPITLADLERLPDDCNKYEVSEGELIVMPPVKSLHTLVALTVLETLQTYLKQQSIGRAIPEAGYLLSRNPLTVRQPDVSVLSNERIASTSEDKYFEGSPELAVEVVSPSDSAQDLETKVEQYLRFGSKQVWIVYPKKKRVHVFRPNAGPAILDESQMLEGGNVLPGFSVKVSDLFV
jgi:Uma2 family endonuclease